MKEKHLHEPKKSKNLVSRPYDQVPAIERLFEPHGVYDGKMFCSTDKATYTFVDHREVISLHFDTKRQAIFYRGHNITNLNLTHRQIQHLNRFEQELGKNSDTRLFAPLYSRVLASFSKQSK